MELTILAAVNLNGVIGKDNDLLWYIPEDLKNYSKLTRGSVLIVGSTTYHHLPKVALEGRTHLVISSKNFPHDENTKIFNNVESVVEYCKETYPNENIYVIGGQTIYEQMIDLCNTCLITYVNGTFPEGNKFFPTHKLACDFVCDEDSGQWIMSKRELEFMFKTYRRWV